MSESNPLESIRIRFRTRMVQSLAAFEGRASEADSALLHAEAHRLAGIAATLGYTEVGQAAAKVDALGGAAADAVSLDHPAVAELIDALHRALAQEDKP